MEAIPGTSGTATAAPASAERRVHRAGRLADALPRAFLGSLPSGATPGLVIPQPHSLEGTGELCRRVRLATLWGDRLGGRTACGRNDRESIGECEQERAAGEDVVVG